jgi:hypothetical protein
MEMFNGAAKGFLFLGLFSLLWPFNGCEFNNLLQIRCGIYVDME